MPAEYDIVGQAPASPLPGIGLSADQVAGLAPVAAAAQPAAPAGVAAPAPQPVRRVAKKPELVSVDLDARQAIVRDALGRMIVVKPLTVVMRMRLVGFLGKELSGNGEYMNMAALGCSVQSIDGDPVAMISDRNGLERVIGKMGDDAIAAAMVGLVALMPADDEPSVEDEAKN